MASEIKDAMKSAADTVARYVKDVATLTVVTQTVEVGSDEAPRLAARTTISIDGDNTSVMPGQRNEAGQLVIDASLYELHMQNVSAAIDYRARLLDSMLGLLRTRLG